LNQITVEEAPTETENEFVIGVENNRASWMFLLAPGLSEKRLWVKNIREAKKQYIQTEQQYLQRQKSSKCMNNRNFLYLRVTYKSYDNFHEVCILLVGTL